VSACRRMGTSIMANECAMQSETWSSAYNRGDQGCCAVERPCGAELLSLRHC
jgi:hypothetical protein